MRLFILISIFVLFFVSYKRKSKTDEKQIELPWIRGEKTPVNKFMTIVGAQCGVTEQEIFNLRQQRNNIDETLWHICNKCLLENQETSNYENLISIYLFMERLSISMGQNANSLIKRRLHFELLQKKKDGMPLAIIISGYDSCKACRELDGKEYSIDEALKIQPLPPGNCTCLRCTCSYS